MRLHSEQPGRGTILQQSRSLLEIDGAGNEMKIIADVIFLEPDRIEHRSSGNVNVQLGDLPLPGHDLHARYIAGAAGIESSQQTPSEGDRMIEPAGNSLQPICRLSTSMVPDTASIALILILGG